MALARRNNNHNLGLIAGAAGADALMQMYPGTREVANIVRQAVNSAFQQKTAQQPRQSSKRTKSKSRNSERRVGPSFSSGMAGTAIARGYHVPGYRFTTQFLAAVTTDASGNVTGGLRLATDDPGSVLNTLTSYCTRCAALRDLYRHIKVRAVRVKFVPVTADTASGTFAICVDADTMTGLFNSPSAMARKDHALVIGIRTPGKLAWKPKGDFETEWKFTRVGVAGGITRPQDQLANSSVLWCANSNVVSGTLGHLAFEVDVEFEDAV